MIQRYHPIVEKALDKNHSVLVLGPRGSGKTFYLKSLLQDVGHTLVIDLLDSSQYRDYLRRPSLLFDHVLFEIERIGREVLFVLVDEVQLVPALMAEAHRAIDAFKGRVVFILTGSSARKLKNKDVDLLASRAISTKFFPFTHREIDFRKLLPQILRFGTLPEIFTTDDEWLMEKKLQTYVGTYLNEEIKKETEIRKIEGFSLFLEYAAHMNGQTINYTKLAKSAGVSPPTVKEYFQILIDTLLITELPPWTYSTKKKLVAAKKYYFFDNGVLNALTQEAFHPIKESSYIYGKLFENLVVNEVIRSIYFDDLNLKCYHYRTERGKEIDLILQRTPFTPPIAIEIKSSSNPTLQDVPEVISFLKEHDDSQAFVFCQTPKPYKQGGVTFVHFLEGMDELRAIA